MTTSKHPRHRPLRLAAATALLPALALTLGACGDDDADQAATDSPPATTSESAPVSTDAPTDDPTTSSAPAPASPSESAPPADPTESTPPTQAPTDTPSATPKPRLISYAGGESPGVWLEGSADTKKLRGAPEDFKQFIGAVADRVVAKSTCGPDAAVGVTVDAVRTDGFAIGGVNDCGGYEALWAKVDGSWKQIQGTQDTWGCAVLKKYQVPSDVAGDSCFAYAGDHQEHDYQQA